MDTTIRPPSIFESLQISAATKPLNLDFSNGDRTTLGIYLCGVAVERHHGEDNESSGEKRGPSSWSIVVDLGCPIMDSSGHPMDKEAEYCRRGGDAGVNGHPQRWVLHIVLVVHTLSYILHASKTTTISNFQLSFPWYPPRAPPL